MANEARKVIEDSIASAGEKVTEEMKIAAALGDAELEKEFADAFVRENDPVEKGRLARVLGFIGTQTALAALASEMRTDLIDGMPMVSLRSVRLDIVAALSFAFPDKPFFYNNAIMDDSGYERVEKFCETTFGVRWKKESPRF